jgi:hypothetical protein
LTRFFVLALAALFKSIGCCGGDGSEGGGVKEGSGRLAIVGL